MKKTPQLINTSTQSLYKLKFPVVFHSPAGWTKEVESEEEGFDASPFDGLSEWQGGEIRDAERRRFKVKRAYRGWPRSAIGLWLCRLLNNVIFVAFDVVEIPAGSRNQTMAQPGIAPDAGHDVPHRRA